MKANTAVEGIKQKLHDEKKGFKRLVNVHRVTGRALKTTKVKRELQQHELDGHKNSLSILKEEMTRAKLKVNKIPK